MRLEGCATEINMHIHGRMCRAAISCHCFRQAVGWVVGVSVEREKGSGEETMGCVATQKKKKILSRPCGHRRQMGRKKNEKLCIRREKEKTKRESCLFLRGKLMFSLSFIFLLIHEAAVCVPAFSCVRMCFLNSSPETMKKKK